MTTLNLSLDSRTRSQTSRIADLKAQRAQASDRETARVREKSKRLDLLSAEKKEKRALMPPVEKKEISQRAASVGRSTITWLEELSIFRQDSIL